jgi:ubiquitin-like 1-activating enzyme E1 A
LNYYEKKQVFPSEDCAEDFVIVAKQFLKEQGLDDDYLGGDDELKQLANTGNAEVAPVCAAIGGVIGNEVLKAISGKGEPANNLLLFNGTDGGCSAFTLK